MAQTPINFNTGDLGFREFLDNSQPAKKFSQELDKRFARVKESSDPREISKKENFTSIKNLENLHKVFSKISGDLRFISLEHNPLGVPLYYGEKKNKSSVVFAITPPGLDLEEKDKNLLANHITRNKPYLHSLDLIEVKPEDIDSILEASPTSDFQTRFKSKKFPVEIILSKMFKKFRPLFHSQARFPDSIKTVYELQPSRFAPKLKKTNLNSRQQKKLIVYKSDNPYFKLKSQKADENDILVQVTLPQGKENFNSPPRYKALKISKTGSGSKTTNGLYEISLADEDQVKAKIEIIGKETILQKLINIDEINNEIEDTLSHKTGRAGEQITKKLFQVLGAEVNDKTRGKHFFDLEVSQGSLSNSLWNILSPDNKNLALEVKSTKHPSGSIRNITLNQYKYFSDSAIGHNDKEPIFVKVNLGDDVALMEVKDLFKDYPPKIIQKKHSIVIKPDPEKSKDKNYPYNKIVLMNFKKLRELAEINVDTVSLGIQGKHVKSRLIDKLQDWTSDTREDVRTRLLDIAKGIEDNVDYLGEFSQLLNSKISDPNLDFNERKLILKIRDYLFEMLEPSLMSQVTNKYNKEFNDEGLIKFIPVRKNTLNEMSERIWDLRKRKLSESFTYSDKLKELNSLDEAMRIEIRNIVQKFLIKEKESHKLKYLEILPFSYTLKEMEYPSEKITNLNSIIREAPKPISKTTHDKLAMRRDIYFEIIRLEKEEPEEIELRSQLEKRFKRLDDEIKAEMNSELKEPKEERSKKLIAFYNKYDKGIYVFESVIPDGFKEDLERLIEKPQQYNKANFSRSTEEGLPFSIQAKNIKASNLSRRDKDLHELQAEDFEAYDEVC